MKKLSFIMMLLALGLMACNNNSENKEDDNADETNEQGAEHNHDGILPSTGNFGKEITPDGAMALNDAIMQMEGNQVMNTKIEARINACCQKKGCWMTITDNENPDIRVTFKDYGFFVPKDCAGKTAILDGKIYWDTIPVADLQHYAEDEGKSEEEIKAITQPEINLAFEAEGVIIK